MSQTVPPPVVPPAAPGALGGIVNRVKEVSASILKQQKPWSEVLDRNALTKPENFGEAVSRIKKNAAYFRVNYFLVMLTTCVATFIMHPTSLVMLSLLVGCWVYVLFIRKEPIVINGKTLSDREKLLAMSAISFITIFFLSNVGTVFFSALSLSLAVVALHGAFREPDNLFVDEAESQQSLMSTILTGAPPAVSVGIATAV